MSTAAFITVVNNSSARNTYTLVHIKSQVYGRCTHLEGDMQKTSSKSLPAPLPPTILPPPPTPHIEELDSL